MSSKWTGNREQRTRFVVIRIWLKQLLHDNGALQKKSVNNSIKSFVVGSCKCHGNIKLIFSTCCKLEVTTIISNFYFGPVLFFLSLHGLLVATFLTFLSHWHSWPFRCCSFLFFCFFLMRSIPGWLSIIRLRVRARRKGKKKWIVHVSNRFKVLQNWDQFQE